MGSVNTVNTFTYNNYGQITTSATVSIAIPSGQVTNFTASVNTLINSATAGSPVYSQRNITPTNTTGNLASTSIILANTPNDGAQVMVYVNGQLQYLGDGTSSNVDCFFGSTSSVAKSISDLTSGDQLYWNGTYVGFDLSITDKIDLVYNTTPLLYIVSVITITLSEPLPPPSAFPTDVSSTLDDDPEFPFKNT